MATSIFNYNDEFIVRDYRENKPLSYIMNKYKVSESYIYRVLRDNNIKPSRAKTTIEKMDIKEIGNLLAAIKDYYQYPNKSVEEITKQHKVKLSAFRYLLQKNDILPTRYFVDETAYKLALKIMDELGVTYNEAVDKCLGGNELSIMQKYKLLLTKIHGGSCRERFDMEPSKLFDVIKLRLVCYPASDLRKECEISSRTMDRIAQIADIDFNKYQKLFKYGLYKNLDNKDICTRFKAGFIEFNKYDVDVIYILKSSLVTKIPKGVLDEIVDKYVNEQFKLSTLSKYTGYSELAIFTFLDQIGIKFTNETPLELGDFILRHKLEIQKYIDIKLVDLCEKIRFLTKHNFSQSELSRLYNISKEQIAKWQKIEKDE